MLISLKFVPTDVEMILSGVHSKKDYEKESPVAVPTYVVDGLGSFAAVAAAAASSKQ